MGARMTAVVRLDDLWVAFEWINAAEAAGVDGEAYVSRETGAIHSAGEGVDEELPANIDDDSRFVPVPCKRDFDLGHRLALRFVKQCMPDSYELVRDYFRSRGAYSRFKGLLDRAGKLDAWHRYEEEAVEQALREWCEEQGLAVDR